MRLTIAANYDEVIVPQLARYPVVEVYGKLPKDLAGGGRPSYMSRGLNRSELRSYVSTLTEHGIAFNYLLNSSCQGNREWTRKWLKQLTAFLEELAEMGVRHLTVSTPFLLETIKKRYPQFRVKVGIFAQIDTPKRAVFWEDLGADALNLESFSINRDFETLLAIREAVSCDLQLIANHCCLPNCPLQSYHQNGFAHSSDGSGKLFIDYCFLRCSRIRLEDPSQFVKSAWIRPEDLYYYERLGYSTFKILERNIPSKELLKRVKAYSDRSFHGNLAELLLSYGFKQPERESLRWRFRHFFKPFQMNPSSLSPLVELARQQGMLSADERPPISIDTEKIPSDFLDFFKNRACSHLDCTKCRYCEKVAESSLSVDPAYRARSLALYKKVEAQIVTGDLWNLS